VFFFQRCDNARCAALRSSAPRFMETANGPACHGGGHARPRFSPSPPSWGSRSTISTRQNPASARLDKQKSRRRIYVGNVHYRQHPLNELIIKTGGRLPCATCMWLAANVHSLKVRDLRREPSMAPRAKSRVVLPSDTVGSATASPSARRAPSPPVTTGKPTDWSVS
jgi:hypothetical protein